MPAKDRRQPLSEAERALFRNAMADVRPLPHDPRAPTPEPPPGGGAQRADSTPATPPTQRPQESFKRLLQQHDASPPEVVPRQAAPATLKFAGASAASPPAPPRVPRPATPSPHGNPWIFKRPGTRQRDLDQLGRRHTKVTKTIDLHNHYLEEAHHKLYAEISHCNATGHHILRVIHGKGRHSPDQKSILREQVPIWLQAHPQVQGFRPSHRTGGGDGSLDVLLRRRPSPRNH